MEVHGTVVPNGEVWGWPSTHPEDPTKKPVKYPTRELRVALADRYETDAWFQPVVCLDNDGSHQPRINKPAALQTRIGLAAVFLDFDLPGHRAWESVQEEAATCETLYNLLSALGVGKPAVYSTAHGARAIWPLAEPVLADVADAYLDVFKRFVLRAGNFEPLELDAKAVGWNRCYRMPHVSRGDTEDDYWVPSYARITDFDNLDWEPPTDLAVEVIRPSITTDEDAPDLRDLTDVEWLHIPAEFRDQLRSGQPLFPSGGRNSGTLNQLLPTLSQAIAAYAPPDPELVYLAMAPGVLAQGEEPTLERLWVRAYAICSNDAAAYANNSVANAIGMAGIPPDVAAAHGEHEKLAKKAADPDAFKKDIAAADKAKRALEKAIKQMDDSRAAQAHQQQTQAVQQAASTAKANKKPWLVYEKGQMAYVLYRDGKYRPKPVNTITTYLEREHATQLRTPKGALMKFPEVFDMMGADAHRIEQAYWRPHAQNWFDATTGVLHLTTDPAGPVSEVYHQDVAEWLRIMVQDPSEHARLLDWLACCLHLDEPIGALFLCGPKGTGKSLLGDAVASFWGPKANYNKSVGTSYNFGLQSNPVLVADDGMKLESGAAVDNFKELVTARFHQVNVKYQAEYYMEGCARIIISGNGTDAIQLPASGTADHNAAVAERIVYVGVSDDAERYLAGIQDIDQWANRGNGPGKIAEHVLWLYTHHKRTTSRGRLLVSGGMSDRWHAERAAKSDGLDGSVLLALAKWADLRKTHIDGIRVDPDEYPDLVLVNCEDLRMLWCELTLDKQPPRSHPLARALSSLSQWQKSKSILTGRSGMRKRYHAVRSDLVLAAAEEAGIGTTESLTAVLSGQTTHRSVNTQRVETT